LPVAYHCLWSIGWCRHVVNRVFRTPAGLFQGARRQVPSSRRAPGWPTVLGGVFTALVVAWFWRAFWFFDTQGLAV
jgi:hypothetical protein